MAKEQPDEYMMEARFYQGADFLSGREAFEKLIAKHLARGWRLQGGVSISYCDGNQIAVSQALTRTPSARKKAEAEERAEQERKAAEAALEEEKKAEEQAAELLKELQLAMDSLPTHSMARGLFANRLGIDTTIGGPVTYSAFLECMKAIDEFPDLEADMMELSEDCPLWKNALAFRCSYKNMMFAKRSFEKAVRRIVSTGDIRDPDHKPKVQRL